MIRALVIGDVDRAEMRPMMRWLKERVAAGEMRMDGEVGGPPSASDHGDVDLIVVLESHPDEYAIDDVYALFAAAPLARILCCAGSWSESAGRTRKIWPPAVRVPAVAAIERLEQEWSLLTGGKLNRYLPATGSREEWFAAHHTPLNSGPHAPVSGESGQCIPAPPLVRIHSPDVAYLQMLHDVCTRAGFTVDKDSAAATIALFDVDPWNADRVNELRRIAESTPVIVLTNWPLPEFANELTSNGAQGVLPKLGDQNRIVRAIMELMTSERAPLRGLRVAANRGLAIVSPAGESA